jgi:hypothetical protein
LKLGGQTGQITGSATVRGTFLSTVTIQDSFSPPEVVTAQVTVTVLPLQLAIANSLPDRALRNRPFTGRVVATGGAPPYKFTLTSGSLPPGFSPIELNTGRVSGTPTTLGTSFFGVTVSDSSPVPQVQSTNFSINVADPIGRNDTIATATAISDGLFVASISPYMDPPDNAPLVADNDYYKIVAVSGSTVHFETQAQRSQADDPLDTVIEVVDGNGTRQSTCRLPGSTSTTFSSACIDDDIGGTPYTLDSALDFKVPGSPSTPTTFYVHVIDWRGDARPDMTYGLQVSGAVAPLAIQTLPPVPIQRSIPYAFTLLAQKGIGTVSWSLTGGTLPAGLMLDSTGLISGSPTADGTFSFTVKASDSSSPPQSATAQESIQVIEPLKITSLATWPDACVGKSYSFTPQASGGLAPLFWNYYSSNWPDLGIFNPTGTISGTPTATGTFMATLSVVDGTGRTVSQDITLTVKQCP